MLNPTGLTYFALLSLHMKKGQQGLHLVYSTPNIIANSRRTIMIWGNHRNNLRNYTAEYQYDFEDYGTHQHRLVRWLVQMVTPTESRQKTDNQDEDTNIEVQLLNHSAYLLFSKPDDLQVCFIESTRFRVSAAFGSLSSIWNIDQTSYTSILKQKRQELRSLHRRPWLTLWMQHGLVLRWIDLGNLL